ncbi:MAG: S-layer homology domain-containing protein [Intestinimonas sp.]|jgi:hypothetical protein|nr:S-layer homology domain-containing protein [Intestinimonas sp.]
MKNSRRLIAGVLALTLAASGLPAAFATDAAGTNPLTSTTDQPGGTPPSGDQGTPPDGSPGDAPGGAPGGASYSDVSSSDWYYEYVNFVTMRGIMSGENGSFNPNTAITRAQFVTALYHAAGSPEVTATTTFTDVSSSDDEYKAVCWAEENGIATGTASSTFNPTGTLTREMAMTFLYRALQELNLTADTPDGTELTSYVDGTNVSSWAQTGMETLVKMGVISGTDENKLNPSSTLTNAETAVLLYRILGGGSAPDGNGAPNDQSQPGGSESSTASNGTAATTISTDSTVDGTTYLSTGDDENALRVDGATVTLDNISVDKTAGDTSSADDSNFYGDNAGLLVTNGATATITGATVNTSVSGGNAVFSYGSGTTVNISDSTITTAMDNSGGIQTAGGGTTNASDLTIQTSGNSSAAIRSDRGGGVVTVDGGTYTTSGSGSPAIYSTADITVEDATLTATNSEAVVVEGKNSVTLKDCNLTGNMTGTYKGDSTENIHNIMLYQSMSGDADVGTASFSATGGSITASAGDMFYVTNTDCTIDLSDVDLTLANGTLLTVAGNSSSRGWGTEGENGGTVDFTAAAQTLEGDVTCDSISSLNFNLTNDSTFKGSINTSGQGGTVSVAVEKGSAWTLTGDCYVTSLSNNGTINYNGYTIYLADGTALTE